MDLPFSTKRLPTLLAKRMDAKQKVGGAQRRLGKPAAPLLAAVLTCPSHLRRPVFAPPRTRTVAVFPHVARLCLSVSLEAKEAGDEAWVVVGMKCGLTQIDQFVFPGRVCNLGCWSGMLGEKRTPRPRVCVRKRQGTVCDSFCLGRHYLFPLDPSDLLPRRKASTASSLWFQATRPDWVLSGEVLRPLATTRNGEIQRLAGSIRQRANERSWRAFLCGYE